MQVISTAKEKKTKFKLTENFGQIQWLKLMFLALI